VIRTADAHHIASCRSCEAMQQSRLLTGSFAVWSEIPPCRAGEALLSEGSWALGSSSGLSAPGDPLRPGGAPGPAPDWQAGGCPAERGGRPFPVDTLRPDPSVGTSALAAEGAALRSALTTTSASALGDGPVDLDGTDLCGTSTLTTMSVCSLLKAA